MFEINIAREKHVCMFVFLIRTQKHVGSVVMFFTSLPRKSKDLEPLMRRAR